MFTESERAFTFSGSILGSSITILDSTASTNDAAMAAAEKTGAPEGIVVAADAQTGGKGRMGRSWISPPGCNLYFTVILAPRLPAEDLSLISLAAPVAAVRAVRSAAALEATIKWPNDIMIADRKTGGILIEMKSGRNGSTLVALGMGINVNMPLESLPPEIRARSTSLMEEKGMPVERMPLLGAILSELEPLYKFLLNGNKGAIIRPWIELNSTLGRDVTVEGTGRAFSGKAQSINDRGELMILCASGTVETVRAGDVTLGKENA
jgi:BirA family biotin operon repressor/biotin-[acetyl-CoA-carboxylase] ligase